MGKHYCTLQLEGERNDQLLFDLKGYPFAFVNAGFIFYVVY
jgi:hypothetical protein